MASGRQPTAQLGTKSRTSTQTPTSQGEAAPPLPRELGSLKMSHSPHTWNPKQMLGKTLNTEVQGDGL